MCGRAPPSERGSDGAGAALGKAQGANRSVCFRWVSVRRGEGGPGLCQCEPKGRCSSASYRVSAPCVTFVPRPATLCCNSAGARPNNGAIMLRSSVSGLKFATFLLVLVGAGACGGDDEFSDSDAQALCRQVADTECEKLYECLSDEQLALFGLTGTVASCKTQLREEYGCDAFTATKGNCKGSEVFKKDKADACVRQTGEASCNQVTSGDEFAPACAEVCVVE